MKKLTCIIIAALIIGTIFTAAAFPQEDSVLPEESLISEEVLLEDAECGDEIELTAEDEKCYKDYLFIGNSLTFFNNMPEMYASIVNSATGQDLSWYSVLYGKRVMYEHACAFEAVARTHGNSNDLNAEEKQYLALRGLYPENYSDEIYQVYKDAVYTADGQEITYGTIVLQFFPKYDDYQKQASAIQKITSVFDCSDTEIVIVMPHNEYFEREDFYRQQDGNDKRAAELKSYLESLQCCKSVKIAYTGRATCNYLLKYGELTASSNYPKHYKVYNENTLPILNDLILSDHMHPTQLGTYLFAATLFTAVYGQNPADTISDFKATSTRKLVNLRLLKEASNYALLNGPLPDALLEGAAQVAYETQQEQRIYPYGVKLQPADPNVPVGKSTQIEAFFLPENATETELLFRSDNLSVADVDLSGQVQAQAYGDVKITASSLSSQGVKKSCSVHVDFADVEKGVVTNALYTSVAWMVKQKIIKNKTAFFPDEELSRGQFVEFLYRFAGCPKSTLKVSLFKDVKANTTHVTAILWATQNKLIGGYSDRTFKPDKTLTKKNVATMLWKYAGAPKVNASSDGTAAAWGRKAGIFSAATVIDNHACQRKDIAVYLYRMHRYLSKR